MDLSNHFSISWLPGQTRTLTSFRLNSSSEAIKFESSSCKAPMHLLCCRKKNAVAMEVMNFVRRILIIEVLYTSFMERTLCFCLNAKQTNSIDRREKNPSRMKVLQKKRRGNLEFVCKT